MLMYTFNEFSADNSSFTVESSFFVKTLFALQSEANETQLKLHPPLRQTQAM